jgi:hypothetical protein
MKTRDLARLRPISFTDSLWGSPVCHKWVKHLRFWYCQQLSFGWHDLCNPRGEEFWLSCYSTSLCEQILLPNWRFWRSHFSFAEIEPPTPTSKLLLFPFIIWIKPHAVMLWQLRSLQLLPLVTSFTSVRKYNWTRL